MTGKTLFLSHVKQLTAFEEREAEWLIPNLLPRAQLTTLASDGGVGKTTLWIHIAAAVSAGKRCFLDPENYSRNEGTVLFLTTEDSVHRKLKRKLREAGANMERVLTADFSEDKSGQLFEKLKFGTAEMAQLIRHYKPTLVIFDPLQGFVPPDVNMGARNAMRNCLAPLIALGEETNSSFLIVAHTNKRKGASARDRIADSADLWDISRSVLMMGTTNEQGVRYLSQEKNNYGQLQKTTLFTISSEGAIIPQGCTWKRDREYMQEFAEAVTTKRDDCKEWLLGELEASGGELPSRVVEERAGAEGFSARTLRRAKDELKQSRAIHYQKANTPEGAAWVICRQVEQMKMPPPC